MRRKKRLGEIIYEEYLKKYDLETDLKTKKKLKKALTWIRRNLKNLNKEEDVLLPKDITHIKFNEISTDLIEINTKHVDNSLRSDIYNELDQKLDLYIEKNNYISKKLQFILEKNTIEENRVEKNNG